jgi:sec-independent protein translocase protein TatC
MPFLDHLEELRWRILWSLLALVLCSVVGFVVVQKFGVIEILIDPVEGYLPDGRLFYLSPTDPFFITLKLAVLVGIIVAFPIVVYQVWSFLSPALEKHEKRVIVPSLYFGLILFASGVAMAYFIALPVTLPFLLGFQTEFLQGTLEVNRYFGFVTKLLIAFGVVFELPVVVMILSALGLVTPDFLKSKRRHAIVLITILASVLSPGDVITVTLLMMIPLVLLYEVSIVLSRVITRRREARIMGPPTEPPDGAVQVGG